MPDDRLSPPTNPAGQGLAAKIVEVVTYNPDGEVEQRVTPKGDERVSLSPLDPREVLRALLHTPPAEDADQD